MASLVKRRILTAASLVQVLRLCTLIAVSLAASHPQCRVRGTQWGPAPTTCAICAAPAHLGWSVVTLSQRPFQNSKPRWLPWIRTTANTRAAFLPFTMLRGAHTRNKRGKPTSVQLDASLPFVLSRSMSRSLQGSPSSMALLASPLWPWQRTAE